MYRHSAKICNNLNAIKSNRRGWEAFQTDPIAIVTDCIAVTASRIKNCHGFDHGFVLFATCTEVQLALVLSWCINSIHCFLIEPKL